jgi:DNA-binding PadR family transcriptional regulator
VRLRAGTLYAALDRLADEKLVEVDREEVVDARLRRYYRLTRRVRSGWRGEVERIRAHSAVAARRLGLR